MARSELDYYCLSFVFATRKCTGTHHREKYTFEIDNYPMWFALDPTRGSQKLTMLRLGTLLPKIEDFQDILV